VPLESPGSISDNHCGWQRWVQPRLLSDVEYTEITPDGLVRHPTFMGLREAKDPDDVHLEAAE
jgi:bifunctional non-homologous end joining protein LigD